MTSLDSGVRTALGLIQVTPSGRRGEGAEEFLEQLIALNESARAGLSQIGSSGTSAGNRVGVSRHLRKPVKGVSTGAERMTSAITCMGEWADKAHDLAQGATEQY